MEQRYLKVSYRMFTNSAASHKLLFETEAMRPVAFVTGMGLMIDAFEERLARLNPGEQFDFTLQPADAFGERDEDLVRPVPRKAFEIRGKFDDEHIFAGAEVPLMDGEGNQFFGTIVRVTDTDVTVDLNNPLAGKVLQFTGTLHENREASLQEIEQTAKMLSGECGGCSGCGDSENGCGGCGGCGK
ncbi:MAG: FKBP-type peptidyl-prolyl cis-trans isomerase [Bacteroidaceae bacterium]|nr:FKBP-type peptidyl-prolyl cis-trans isomerase [Bacteroidaceae bacterium]